MSFNPCVGARQVLRLGATTTSFDAAPTPVRVQNWNMAAFLVDVTLGAATSVELQVDFATPDDGVGKPANPDPMVDDWYTRAFTDIVGAVSATGTMTVPSRALQFQFVASGKYEVQLPIMAKWMRVRAKSSGAAATTVVVTAVEGMA